MVALAEADLVALMYHLDETDEAILEKLTALIAVASGIVSDHLGQHIALVENDEITLTGMLSTRLTLPERPIVSVASVTLNGVAVTDYTISGPDLVREGKWDGAVAVTYAHGFDPIPHSVQTVVAQIVGRAYTQTDNVKTEQSGQHMVTLVDPDAWTLSDKQIDRLSGIAEVLGVNAEASSGSIPLGFA